MVSFCFVFYDAKCVGLLSFDFSTIKNHIFLSTNLQLLPFIFISLYI